MLQFKTRGNTSPQGKAKVYFCAHPEDQGFLESIAAEILKLQNCAVYYGEGEPDELESMNLFVMPVTRKLLHTDNKGLREFRFAMEKHIPVLPLMQESDLSADFNKICGDLQYLDPYQQDSTALDYREKLEKFLSALLIGDEMAARIRAAFDAYVFLSYRKKDRKYAKELMKLIHQNEFCRDIAIWYDEYLTPGEDFNKEIADALDKSKLFALAVTPSLLEHGNYVMKYEYPMAKAAGKKILPAELVSTDSAALGASYADIPTAVDAYNAPALEASLLKLLEDIAVRENDNDPTHNFLIGLAYRDGIDVEVDRERALKLITSAAETCYEAAKELVEMYRSGNGVERNYRTAIEWQEQVIALAQKAYDEEPSEERADKLLWSNITCGEYLQELGSFSKAEAYFVAAESLAIKNHRLFGSKKSIRNVAAAEIEIGDYCFAVGNMAYARKHYDSSFTLFRQMVLEKQTESLLRCFAESCDRLGNVCHEEKDYTTAREYYEAAFKIRKTLMERINTVLSRAELSRSYYKLGGINRSEGKMQSAREYFEKALVLDEQILSENETVEARRNYGLSCDDMGRICMQMGDYSAARRYFEKAVEFAAKLVCELGTASVRRDLLCYYGHLGDLCVAEGTPTVAREFYGKQIALCEELAGESGSAQSRKDLSFSYVAMGDAYNGEKEYASAGAYYEKALAVAEALAGEDNTAVSKRTLYVICQKMGLFYRDEYKRRRTQESLDLMNFLFEKNEGTAMPEQARKSGDDLEAARTYYEKALNAAKALVAEASTAQNRNELALSYLSLADITVENGLKQEYYRAAYGIWAGLAEEFPEIETYRKGRDLAKKRI